MLFMLRIGLLIVSSLLFRGGLCNNVLVPPVDVLVTEGENATFYCEVDDDNGLYWIFNDADWIVAWSYDDYMNYPFGGGLYVDSRYEYLYRSGSYYDITMSNLTVAFAGLHQDNTTVKCCSIAYYLYYSIMHCSSDAILRVQNLQEPLNVSLELVNRTGAVRLTWELPPDLDPSIITHYTVAVTGDEQLFNSTAVNVTDTYFTYILLWLAWQQPTCSLVNFSVSMWNILGTEGNQAHQNAFLCSFREEVEQKVYVECECGDESSVPLAPTVMATATGMESSISSSSTSTHVAQTQSCPLLPTTVPSAPCQVLSDNTLAIIGSAISVPLLFCVVVIFVLLLTNICMCIKMSKVKTTLSNSRRKSEQPKETSLEMEENNAYEMVQTRGLGGQPQRPYDHIPSPNLRECRDNFKKFRATPASSTVTTEFDGPKMVSCRRAETVPVPTASHVFTHVPFVRSRFDDEAPPPPLPPPRYHEDQ